MWKRRANALTLVLALFVLGCQGEAPPTATTAFQLETSRSQAATMDFQCPANPDKIVQTRDGLIDAVRTSAPGTVIAIDGTIELPQHVTIPVDQEDLTVTCVTPGSGVELVENPDRPFIQNLFSINGPKFTLHDLRIDARRVDGEQEDTWARAAVFASDNGVEPGSDEHREDADGVRIQDNLILLNVSGDRETTGGWGILVSGPQNPVVSGNTIRADGKATGGLRVTANFFAQKQFDGVERAPRPTDAVVQNNTVRAKVNSLVHFLGGVVVSAGPRAEITDNTVTGPWQNGVVVNDIDDGRVTGNTVSNSLVRGIRFNRNPGGFTRGAQIKRNRIEEAGTEAFWVQKACGNLFKANALVRNSHNATFDTRTGNNEYFGNPRKVTDEGNYDCDGDGTADPNDIRGSQGN